MAKNEAVLVSCWSCQCVFQSSGHQLQSHGLESSGPCADPLINFTSTAAGSVVVNPIAVAKLGTTYTYTPRFEYKKGNLQIEGRFAASDSESTYEPQQRRASFFQLGSPTANGVTFAAQRSSLTSAAWQVRQVAGPDIGSGASFTSPTIFT